MEERWSPLIEIPFEVLETDPGYLTLLHSWVVRASDLYAKGDGFLLDGSPAFLYFNMSISVSKVGAGYLATG